MRYAPRMGDRTATAPQVIYGGQAFASGAGARATAAISAGQSYESAWLPISVQSLAAAASANGAGDLYIDVSNDKVTITSSSAVSVSATGAGSEWVTITSEGFAFARLRFVASATVSSLTWTLVARAALSATAFVGPVKGNQSVTTLEATSLGVGTAAPATKGDVALVDGATPAKSGIIRYTGTTYPAFKFEPAGSLDNSVSLGYGLQVIGGTGTVVAYLDGSGHAHVPSLRLATHATLYSGATAPAATLGVVGDYYFRTGAPATVSARLYVKDATGWQAVGASSPTATHLSVYIAANVTTILSTAAKNVTSLALTGTASNRWLVTCAAQLVGVTAATNVEVALAPASASMVSAFGAAETPALTNGLVGSVSFGAIVAGGQTVYLNAQCDGVSAKATALAHLTHATANTVTGINAVKIA